MPISCASRREPRHRSRRLGLFVPFALLVSSSQATDLYWKDATSGLWNVGANWSNPWAGGPFVPGPGDRAFIGGASDPASAWTVTLGGDVSIDALFSRAALNLAGHALTLASASTVDGSLDLTGASLLGAGSLAATGSVTLSGTTLGAGGTLTLGGTTTISSATSAFDRDIVATGTTVWNSGASFDGAKILGAGTFTNVGTFTMAAQPFGHYGFSANFVNAGTLNGSGLAEFYGTSFQNSGTVLRNGSNLIVSAATFANTGTISVTGGLLTLNAASNDNAGGTIEIDGAGSTGYLNGGWKTGGLGTLLATNGGQFVFGGKLDNSGATFDMAAGVIAQFQSATIHGGSVAHSDTLLGPGTALTYDGAALDAGLRLGGGQVFLQNGTTLGMAKIELGNGAEVGLNDASATFSGTLTNALGGFGTLHGGILTLGTSTVATASGPVGGYSGLRIIASGDLTNLGTLHADANAQLSLQTSAGRLRNVGRVDSLGGTVSMSGKTFDNASGTIQLNAAVLNFGGDTTLAGLGTISGANGRAFYTSGTLALGGGTLDLTRFGSGVRFGLQGGTLANGFVTHSDLLLEGTSGDLTGTVVLDKGLKLTSALLNSYGSLDLGHGDLNFLRSHLIAWNDLRFDGEVRLTQSRIDAVRMLGLKKATLVDNSGMSAAAFNLDSLSLSGNSHVTADAASTVGSLTSSAASYESNLLNAPGLTLGDLTVASGPLYLSTNGHGRIQVNGDVSVDGALKGSLSRNDDVVDVNGGVVTGLGSIESLSLHGATVSPGHSTGALQVGGFQMDAASRFLLEIGGSASSGLFDRLNTSTASLNGALSLSLVNGYTPQAGTWRFLTATSGLTGTFSTRNLGAGWRYGQDATGAYVSFAPVPEPASLAVLSLGLAAVTRRRRRKA